MSSTVLNTVYVPDFMRKGSEFIKYHNRGSSAKRIIFYSNDRLYWCSPDGGLVADIEHSIQVCDIISIYRGKAEEITEIWSNSSKANKADPNKCLTLVTASNPSITTNNHNPDAALPKVSPRAHHRDTSLNTSDDDSKFICIEAQSVDEAHRWSTGIIQLFSIEKNKNPGRRNSIGGVMANLSTNWKVDWKSLGLKNPNEIDTPNSHNSDSNGNGTTESKRSARTTTTPSSKQNKSTTPRAVTTTVNTVPHTNGNSSDTLSNIGDLNFTKIHSTPAALAAANSQPNINSIDTNINAPITPAKKALSNGDHPNQHNTTSSSSSQQSTSPASTTSTANGTIKLPLSPSQLNDLRNQLIARDTLIAKLEQTVSALRLENSTLIDKQAENDFKLNYEINQKKQLDAKITQLTTEINKKEEENGTISSELLALEAIHKSMNFSIQRENNEKNVKLLEATERVSVLEKILNERNTRIGVVEDELKIKTETLNKLELQVQQIKQILIPPTTSHTPIQKPSPKSQSVESQYTIPKPLSLNIVT